MEQSSPECERVLANKEKVNDLEDCELIKEDPAARGEDEHGQLGHHGPEVVNFKDLGGNNTANANRRDPHDGGDHPHDDLVNDGEELNDPGGLLSNSTENNAKGQAEEDDAEHVG